MTAKKHSIVYVWDADYPWDVRVEKTCLALVGAGHEVHIVARNRKWSPTTERLPEGTVHRMPPWRWAGQKADSALGFPAFFSPRWHQLIAGVVKEVSADLIIARDLPLCPTAIQVGRTFGIPVILDMAENYPAMLRAIWTAGRARLADHLIRNPSNAERVERYCLKRVAHVWVVSSHARHDAIAQGVLPDRVTIVGNTPSRQRAQTHHERHDRHVMEIVYLGILEIPRGVGDLITAMSHLRKQGVPVRLKLIGDGRDTALFREQTAACGLGADVVEFAGFVPYQEALDAIETADIGATPLHRNEHMDKTLPNKLFDYMSAGLPILTSDVTASAQLVRSLGVGEVFKAQDVDSLAAAITRLQDRATRAHMGRCGRQAIIDTYNWESDTTVLLESIEDACGQPCAASHTEPLPR